MRALSEVLDLSGQTAIVTGGATGIGLGIVRRLHEAGANVLIADVEGDAAAQVAADLGPSRVVARTADVSDGAAVDAMVDAAVTQFGGLDIMVNNAGVYPTASFLDVDVDTARRTIEVNLMGVMMCCQAAARQMVAQGRGGKLITVDSIESITPSVIGLAHYAASKGGVATMLKTVALELAPHGIAVNSVAPGAIRTSGLGPIPEDVLASIAAGVPMKRFGDPDEIGKVVLFLASDLASYMTGSHVVVDGGRILCGAGEVNVA